MQKCFVTKETIFTIEFTDSDDARVFYNRAHDPFSYIGSLDWDGLIDTVSFTSQYDVEKFEQFLKENLESVTIENGKTVYRLYKPYIPEPVRIGE